MRRSLFDQYQEEHYQPPRIRPNIFARLAQFCFNWPWFIISIWVLISILCAVYSINKLKSVEGTALEFSQYSKPARDTELFNQNFPNLNGLSKVTLTSKNSENLKSARKELLSKLDERSDLFSTVLVPGSGSYYDANGLLYRPIETVQASVNYALALRPLFAAVAEQPNMGSLTTLINEVSASIEMGRDPQGLDDLFSEAANATNALMKKIERPVNWKNVAGLDADPNPLSAQVLIVPTLGKNAEANAFLESATNEVTNTYRQTEGKISIAKVLGEDLAVTKTSVKASQNLGPLISLAIILAAAILLSSLGHVGLCAMVTLPAIATLTISSALFAVVLPQQSASLWFIVLGLTFSTLSLSLRYSCAALEAFSLARSRTSAIMLAAQRQGNNLVAVAAVAGAPWLAWNAMGERTTFALSFASIATLFMGLLCSLSMVPAIAATVRSPLRWSAVEWILPLYEQFRTVPFWRLARNILASLIVLVALAGAWATPLLFEKSVLTPAEIRRPVHLIASKQTEIPAILATLKTVPDAQSVQWLNTFLPTEAAAKIKILSALKDQFAPVAPQQAQDPDTIRDQISTLLESLQSIANSPATRRELAVLAHDFRRSLEIFNSTATNQEIVQFEKRMFGAFNVLPEYAQELVSLKVPDMEALDPALRAIFRSENGAYRLTVQPANNLSTSELAQKLEILGLPVVHPTVVNNFAQRAQFRNAVLISGLVMALGWLALATVLRRVDWMIIAIMLSILVASAVVAAFAWYHKNASIQVLLLLTLALSQLFAGLASTMTEKHQSFDETHEALLRTQAWTLPLLAAALALANLAVSSNSASNLVPLFAILVLLAGSANEFIARPILQKL